MTWWRLRVPEIARPATILQVDLQGHSCWIRRMLQGGKSMVEVAAKRAELPAMLDANLRFFGFARVQWLGDGGVFARINDANLAELLDIDQRVFDCFSRWRDDAELSLRVSVTYISDLVVDSDPGNWMSPQLNDFLKHERELSSAGEFIVADKMFEKLQSRHQEGSDAGQAASVDPVQYFDRTEGSHQAWKLRSEKRIVRGGA